MAGFTPRRKAPRPVRTPAPLLIVVLSLLSLLTALLQTMVVPVLGRMGDALGTSTATIGWVVTINLLAAAVMTPVLSKIGDLHGRRRLLLALLTAVAVGSLLAATTSDYWLLLLARVIQGASFCFLPLSIAIARDNLAPRHVPIGFACLTGGISVGAGFGLVLAGMLLRGGGDYHSIFWFATAVALVLLLAVTVVVPNDIPSTSSRVDWLGGFGLGVALLLLLLAMTQGNTWGWTSPATTSCLVGAAVVFAVWIGIEKRVAAPLVPVDMMRHGTLAAVNAISLVIGFGFFAIFLGVTALVQVPDSHTHGFSATVWQTSVVFLLPAAAIGVVASPLGGAWVGRFGARITLVIASGIGVIGYLQLTFWHSATWHIILGVVLTNMAFNVGFAAIPAVVMSIVRPEETALANAVTSISRTAGSAVGSALVVALISGHLMNDGHPSERVFTIIFGVGAASMVLSLVITVLGIPRRSAVVAVRPDAADPDLPPPVEEEEQSR